MKKLIKYVFSFVFVLLILSNSHNVHASVLINESFDGTTFPPTGWVKSSTSTLDWIRSTNTVHPSGGGTHSGAGLAYVNNWSTSSGTASLFTPLLDFSAGSDYVVSFWMYRDGGYLTTADVMNVYVNTSVSTTGATLIGTVNRSKDLSPVVATAGWYKYTFNVPGTFNGASNYVIFSGTSAYGNDIHIDDIIVESLNAPVITTESASSIDANTVTLNGNITSAGGDNPTIRGFQYGLTDSYGTNVLEEGSFSAGAYTASLTGLTPNTTYHYRAYATNGVGQSFGSDQTFTTLPISSPTVTTGLTISHNYTTITLNGTITALGGNNVTIRGFEYGLTTSYGTTTTEEGSFGVGSYTSEVTGLTCETTYHYRSYSTNLVGTGYGNDQTFITSDCPNIPIIKTRTSITVNWESDGGEYYIENITNNTNSGWITEAVYKFTELTCGTEYSFRVKSRDAYYNESYWSDIITHSTSNCSASPLIDTITPDSRSSMTVSYSGNVPNYFIENITNSTNSGWITENTYQFTDLTCNTEYSFRIKGRDIDESETLWSSTSTTLIPCIVTEVVNGSATITTQTDFENGALDSSLNSTDSAGDIYLNPLSGDSYEDTLPDFSFTPTFDGEFSSPQGITTDSLDNIYVADTNNNRIQKFSSDGTFITKWGTNGSGDVKFSGPYGIITDSLDNVYVEDTGGQRIQKFSSDGTFITKWGINGSGDGEFNWPYGITIDSLDNIYVVDKDNNRIQKFSSDGTFITKWGSYGIADGEFKYPQGITTDSLDNIYVADTLNQRIQKFSSDGTFISKWGSYGIADGKFEYPYGITNDASDNIYVADTQNHRIQKFSSDGTFISKWGSYGSGDGEFNWPNGLTTDSSGNIYVADPNNNRIQKFSYDSDTETATFLESWSRVGALAEISKFVDVNSGALPWQQGTPLSLARMAAGSGVINGKVYIAGGIDDSGGNNLDSLIIYNPETDQWDETKPSMSIARGTPVSVTVGNNLYIIGGKDSSGGLQSMDIYNSEIDTWDATKAQMSTKRIGAAGDYYDGKIYVVGGSQNSCDVFQISGEVYDIANNTWASIAPAPIAKMSGATAQFINGIMYVAGGQTNCTDPFSNKLISYNPSNNTWNTNLTNMPTARAGGSSVVIDGKLYYIGGTNDDYNSATDIFSYDPITNTWTTYGDSLFQAIHRPMTEVIGSDLYVIGGRDNDWNAITTNYIINKSYLGVISKKISSISWTATTLVDTEVELFYSLDNGDTFTSLGTNPGTYDLPEETTNSLTWKAILRNFTTGDNPSLDSISFAPTVSGENSGTFTSTVINAGKQVDWTTLNTDSVLPTGTSITYQTRSGPTAIPNETWSSWQDATGNIPSPNNQYLQIKATLSSNSDETPILHSITINYGNISKKTGSSSSAILSSQQEKIERAEPLNTNPEGCTSATLYSPLNGQKCNSSSKNPNPSDGQATPTITRVLKQGMTGSDVKALQVYLNTHGYIISLTGAGSFGNETNYFGLKTKQAVIKFQLANGLVGDGIVGKLTKGLMK